MKPFNDYNYCESVEEWENLIVPETLRGKKIEWASKLAIPHMVIGLALAGNDWKKWLAILGIAYLLMLVFTFFEEVNENIRFVRHQLRAYRDSVRKSAKEVSKYGDQDNVTVTYALELLDRNWDQP